jgi:translation initiation factor 2 gamma subunit (eIF-2gamma)
LFTQIKEQLKNVMNGPVIVVSAAQVTNLQGLLRTIISGCLQIELPDEEEDQQPSTAKVLSRQCHRL